MGVNKNLIYNHNNLQSFDFLLAQSHWGHKKEKLNYRFNNHILGFRNDFAIIKSDHSIEYFKRCNIFCFNDIIHLSIN